MAYTLKEIFYTLQGEGVHAGRAAIFCRFAGCNLWSGWDRDRQAAVCKFCDTDFVHLDAKTGGKYESSAELCEKITSFWPGNSNSFPGWPFVVFTGGEPALQLDEDLIKLLQDVGFETAVETNGTLDLPSGLDWVCVSPKENTTVKVRSGSELKLIFPQDIDPQSLEDWNFDHFFLQPMSGEKYRENLQSAVDYCLQNPRWKLSLQTQKYIDIP